MNKVAKLAELQAEYKRLQAELAEENTTSAKDQLYTLLYSAIVRFGVREPSPGLVVIQVPNMQVDPAHKIVWDVAEDKKSFFVRIVQPPLPEPEPESGVTIGKPVDEEAAKAMQEVIG